MLLSGVTGGARAAAASRGFELAGGQTVTAPVVDRRAGDGAGGGSTLDGIDELLGRGVYYGAGRSEAAQCGGDDVVGDRRRQLRGPGGDEPRATRARDVTMVVRGDSLAKSMSGYLVDRIERHTR